MLTRPPRYNIINPCHSATVSKTTAQTSVPVTGVDAHRRDVRRRRDAAHGHRFHARFVEQSAGGSGDPFRGWPDRHVYTVYITDHNCRIASAASRFRRKVKAATAVAARLA